MSEFITLTEAYEKATPGPFTAVADGRGVYLGYGSRQPQACVAPMNSIDSAVAGANAALLAHAFNVLPDVVNALDLMRRHHDDLSKSNPGFMGKLALQDYALWNEALTAMGSALAKADRVEVARCD